MAAPSNRLLSTQNPKSIGFMWVFAVLWCGVSFPVFWMFAIQMRQVAPGIVGGLFAAFGLVMLFFTVRATLEYVKFGQVDLTLDGEPAVGRGFGAMVRLPASPALAKLTAELACVQLIPDRDAKGEPTTREADAWTLKQEFPVRRGAAGAYATLRFDVPADQPATTTAEDIGLDEAQMKEAFKDLDLAKFRALHAAAARAQARGSYRWELRIRADVPGIDLDRTFNLSMAPAPAGTVAQPGGAAREWRCRPWACAHGPLSSGRGDAARAPRRPGGLRRLRGHSCPCRRRWLNSAAARIQSMSIPHATRRCAARTVEDRRPESRDRRVAPAVFAPGLSAPRRRQIAVCGAPGLGRSIGSVAPG